MPNWLGDGVMATPFLRTLRGLYPAAHIAAIHKPLLAAVLAGLPFVDQAIEFSEVQKGGGNRIDSRRTVEILNQGKFDLAILLPNSFRSALLAWRAGISHRVGYARENRGLLLNHRLKAQVRNYPEWLNFYARTWARTLIKDQCHRPASEQLLELRPKFGEPKAFEAIFVDAAGQQRQQTLRVGLDMAMVIPRLRGYQPMPTIDYYLEIAKYLGATELDKHMELGVGEVERAEAQAALESTGFVNPTNTTEPSGTAAGSAGLVDGVNPLVVIVPGANFGSSKCWPPERFAVVADALIDPQGTYRASVVLAASPAEKPVVDAILAASKHNASGRMIWSGAMANGRGISVGALKEIVRRSRMMICNDTGPRHFAAAFNVPTVALFGPTDHAAGPTPFQKMSDVYR